MRLFEILKKIALSSAELGNKENLLCFFPKLLNPSLDWDWNFGHQRRFLLHQNMQAGTFFAWVGGGNSRSNWSERSKRASLTCLIDIPGNQILFRVRFKFMYEKQSKILSMILKSVSSSSTRRLLWLLESAFLISIVL